MTTTTIVRRPTRALQLPVVPEPIALRQLLRIVAEGAPGRAAELLVDPVEVAGYLWERWRADLEAAGIEFATYRAVVEAYRRELWYWLWGNRTWAHCTQGLAGRLARRVAPVER